MVPSAILSRATANALRSSPGERISYSRQRSAHFGHAIPEIPNEPVRGASFTPTYVPCDRENRRRLGTPYCSRQETFKYLLTSAVGRIATAAKREVPKQS